ncbi:hypothetical protein [Nonomuraea sp. NPDC049158]|uniref:hypothetical protein n=1 Tax=Nonomuraea sp. NPDC049158 TaxID=3155649 RepID=UPI0033D28A9B
MASGLGMSTAVAAWAALCVAVASQVTWAVTAAVKIGSSRGVVVGIASLIFSLAIVAFKIVIAGH